MHVCTEDNIRPGLTKKWHNYLAHKHSCQSVEDFAHSTNFVHMAHAATKLNSLIISCHIMN
jgi:hypothetical protein